MECNIRNTHLDRSMHKIVILSRIIFLFPEQCRHSVPRSSMQRGYMNREHMIAAKRDIRYI